MGLGDFESALIEACLHDQAYDPQCEDDRADWVMEIVDASDAVDRITPIVLPQLDAPTDSYWDARHRCRIALALALRGNQDARQRLYSCLRRWPGCADMIGCNEIIALDGAEGLVHVAEFQGSILQEDPTFWADEYPLHAYDDRHGEGAAWHTLKKAAEHRPLIAAYLDQLEAREKQRQAGEVVGPGYLTADRVTFNKSAHNDRIAKLRAIPAAKIIHDIETDTSQRAYALPSWGMHAAEDDISAVFNAMMSQSEPGRLHKYLWVFSRRALPAFDARLLRFADDENADVRRVAYGALSNYAHPEVRSLALTRISAGRLLEGELRLLQMNYQPEDADLIEGALPVPADRYELHDMILDLVEIFRRHPGAEARGVMLFVCEHSPCSNCRLGAVEVLVGTGTLPDWMREEGRHDCVEKIRLLAKP